MSTNVNIAATPMAPYMGLLDSMNRNEKIAVAMFLVKSLPGIEIVESNESEAISKDDKEFLAEKLSEMTFSPRVRKLMELRKKAAEKIDLNDERTRYILGLQ